MNIEDLLRRMNVRGILGWQPDYAVGKPLYDELVVRVADTSLTKHQTANVLVALMRLRHCGSEEEVMERLLGALQSPHQRVRDQAVRLVIGLMRIRRWAANVYSPRHVKALSDALTLGVDPDAATAIDALLRSGPETSERSTHFLVTWPVQGEFHFRSPRSELVLSDVYWSWIYSALLELRDDGQQLPFVKAAEAGFRDPTNLVEILPVNPRFLELLQQISPSLAPSFDKLETSDGSPPPTPEQILAELVRLVGDALTEGTIEMEMAVG